MTTLIRNLINIIPQNRGGVLSIGNFDGVHTGHKALIDKVKERAAALHAPTLVMTFEPQPLEYFAPKEGVARLTRFREKWAALKRTNIDYVLVLQFNEKLASLTPAEFTKHILVDTLAIEHIIVGEDFRFGHHREGDLSLLQTLGEDYGFTVETMPTVLVDNEKVSSTRVRRALKENNTGLAERLLGRPYSMMGRVVHGDKLGRKLGFPTANIYLHRAITPVQGIYTVRMHGIENRPLPGVANVGIRPAIGGTRSLLEVFLFDFDRDIYGQHVKVEFCKKLRDEAYYANLDLLKEAISNDAKNARDYFERRNEL